MIERNWRRLSDWVTRWEEVPWGPGTVAALLAAVIAVRNLLEITVARNPVFDALAAFVHYPLAYVGPFLALVLVLAFWAQVAPARVARLMALAWLLTLVPPLADLLLHHRREVPTIGYLAVDPADIGWIIVHFFDPRVSLMGTTGGIRLETGIAVLAAAAYVALRSRRVTRVLGVMVSVYAASLFFFLLPAIVLGVFRLLFPMTSLADLLRGEGAVFRGTGDALDDAAAILWLVPVLATLVAAWRWVEGRTPGDSTSGWAGPTRDRRAASSTSHGLFLAAIAMAGMVVARIIRQPSSLALTIPPYDYLAPVGLILALVFGSRLVRSGAMTPFVRLAHLIAVVALALALGRSVAIGLAVALLVSLGASQLRLKGPLAGAATHAAAFSLAAAGAVAAGWALIIGPEALARIPVEILVAALMMGLCVGIAGALFAGQDRPRWSRRIVGLLLLSILLGSTGVLLGGPPLLAVGAPLGLIIAGIWYAFPQSSLRPTAHWTRGLASGLVFFLLLVGATSNPTILGQWRERTSRVARLERIKGERYFEQGQWNQARSVFKSALEMDPNDVGALRGLGLGYIAQKRLRRGTHFLERALDVDPDNPQQIVNLAAAYLDQNRWSEALELIDRALSRNPRNLLAWLQRCDALDGMGRVEQAIVACSEYLELAEGRPGQDAAVREIRRRLRKLGASGKTPSET
ncbi:MAG: tetratricopeptide repeat protein, partial [Acidobacteriota bacterium]|nr:tetratricopeptide repeat protein [Acidobacteriota bacterium]